MATLLKTRFQGIRLVFSLWAFLHGLSLTAQDYIAKIEHYSVEQGLSHRQVNAIFQDRQGFMWLGTPNGLNRFDGYSFRSYTKEKDGLLFNDIIAITQDPDGWLWLTERESGEVCLFYPESGQVYSLKEKFGAQYPEFAATHFESQEVRGDDGAIWLTVAGNGLFYRYHPQDGVRAIHIEGYQNVRPVYYAPDKTIWARTDGNFFIQINEDGKVLKQMEKLWLYGDWAISQIGFLATSPIYANLEDFKFLNLQGETLPYKPPGLLPGKGPYPALVLPFDEHGTFIIHDRLVNAQGMELAHWDFVQHDRNNFIWRSFFRDRLGRLWLGDEFGFYILQIRKNRFQHYLYKKDARPALGNSIRGILVTPEKVYANVERGSLFEINPSNGQGQLVEAIQPNWGNYGLAFTQNGQVLSGREKALTFWKPGEKTAETISTEFNAWSFCEENSGRIWIGSSDKGLHILQSGASHTDDFTEYNGFNSLASAFILDIKQDRSGILWVCANNGFYRVDPNRGVLARYWTGGAGHVSE